MLAAKIGPEKNCLISFFTFPTLDDTKSHPVRKDRHNQNGQVSKSLRWIIEMFLGSYDNVSYGNVRLWANVDAPVDLLSLDVTS